MALLKVLGLLCVDGVFRGEMFAATCNPAYVARRYGIWLTRRERIRLEALVASPEARNAFVDLAGVICPIWPCDDEQLNEATNAQETGLKGF